MTIFDVHPIPDNALNVFNLNEVRQIGEMKRQIKIATKLKAKNVNYDLIEISRTETIREQFDYCGLHEL